MRSHGDPTLPAAVMRSGITPDVAEWAARKVAHEVNAKQRKLWYTLLVLGVGLLSNFGWTCYMIGSKSQYWDAAAQQTRANSAVIASLTSQVSGVQATVNQINDRTAEIERRMDDRPHDPP